MASINDHFLAARSQDVMSRSRLDARLMIKFENPSFGSLEVDKRDEVPGKSKLPLAVRHGEVGCATDQGLVSFDERLRVQDQITNTHNGAGAEVPQSHAYKIKL